MSKKISDKCPENQLHPINGHSRGSRTTGWRSKKERDLTLTYGCQPRREGPLSLQDMTIKMPPSSSGECFTAFSACSNHFPAGVTRELNPLSIPLDTAALVTAFALGSAALGYWLGTRRVRRASTVIPSTTLPSIQKRKRNTNEDLSLESDSDEEGASGDGELGNVKAGLLEDCKLVRLRFVLFSLLVPRGIRQSDVVIHG